MVKFKDIPYHRPDIGEAQKAVAACTAQLNNAASFEAADTALQSFNAFYLDFVTQQTLCHIRASIDVSDAFYEAEQAFFDEQTPQLMGVLSSWNKAQIATKFRPQFEAKYGAHYLNVIENEIFVQNPVVMPEMIEENKLVSRYQKVSATASADFRGEKCNFYGLLKYMEDSDRATRKEAFERWAKLYTDISVELDEIYDELIKVRCAMAKKLELPRYTELAYLGKNRLDYGPADVEKFRDQVVRYIVPACQKLRDAQAKRIGVDKLKYYDETFVFPDGNADPIGTKDEMIAAAQKMYRELSPETGEFFDYMVQYDLFDLDSKQNKRPGGYCTGIPNERAPFIFSNFNGTAADADVLTHEAGHAFAFFTASRIQPLPNCWFSTSEIAEIHSMTMEHFTYPWMESFFGDGLQKYLYSHLNSSLGVIPYLTSVDEFQHRVFDNPSMSADERRAVWKAIEQKYMPWRDYDGEPYMGSGGFWMQKQHIFMFPFYYIDYALAQMGAFELYLRMLDSRETAWRDYLNLCRLGGSKPYFESLNAARLSSPFDSGTVERIVTGIMAQLDKNPLA